MLDQELSITLVDEQVAFDPGSECVGKVGWNLPSAPEKVQLKLLWKVSSEAPDDTDILETVDLDHPYAQEARGFRFVLPEGPYSFNGQVLDLVWSLELVITLGREKLVQQKEIVIAPGRVPLQLEEIQDDSRKMFSVKKVFHPQ